MEAYIDIALWRRRGLFEFGPKRGGRRRVDSCAVGSNKIEALSLLRLWAPEAGLLIIIDDRIVTGCFQPKNFKRQLSGGMVTPCRWRRLWSFVMLVPLRNWFFAVVIWVISSKHGIT